MEVQDWLSLLQDPEGDNEKELSTKYGHILAAHISTELQGKSYAMKSFFHCSFTYSSGSSWFLLRFLWQPFQSQKSAEYIIAHMAYVS